MNERCWVLVGYCAPGGRAWFAKQRRRMDGQPASVEADWAWTLRRDEMFGDVVGFLHTHPPGAGTTLSERDRRTMQAWCSALGKPLVCIIVEGRAGAAYVFADAESDGRPARSVKQVTRSKFTING